MRSVLPERLFIRLLLIWLIGILVVLFLSFGLFVGDRGRLVRNVMYENLSQEIAATVHMLDALPPVERARWLGTFNRRRFSLEIAPSPPPQNSLPADHPFSLAVHKALPKHPELQLSELSPPHGRGALLQLRLADGTPLRAQVRLNLAPPPPPMAHIFAPMAAFVLGMLILTALALHFALRPLRMLADAARQLGEDPQRPPLGVDGPLEVRHAIGAFNHMQQRIQAYLRERTRLLAAISHDLQTPITRLRLRTEQIDDSTLRHKFENDLDAMQSLVREGLDYARSQENTEKLQPLALDALLSAIAADAEDMGWQVRLHGNVARPWLGRPGALRRALWNLVENGIKFGDSVEIELGEDADGVHIRCTDHGPGLPEKELEKVFEPFYRGEASRNRATGGTGLGLAIARNLIRAQGGTLTLANAPQGGLRADVHLPQQQPAPAPAPQRRN